MILLIISVLLMVAVPKANVLFKNIPGELSYLVGVLVGILYAIILEIVR